MNIVLHGSGESLSQLKSLVQASLSELKYDSLVTLSVREDSQYALDLGITQSPALCVEETSIDFRDMIFEGIIPERSELDAMFRSILGTDEASSSGGCGTCSTWGCGTCSTGGCSDDECSTETHERKWECATC